jgi:hypothetical protein
MKQKTGKTLIFGLVVLSLLFTSACASETQQTELPETEPVVHVTQFITQVVATSPPATLTPVPTFTPSAPPTYSGWDPLAQPIYYPVMGCNASRLHVGDRAFAAYVSGVSGFYLGKDIFFDPLIRKPQAGEVVDVIDGPWCRRNVLIWKVFVNADQREAFSPEGDGAEYWLLPMKPYTPTPEK